MKRVLLLFLASVTLLPVFAQQARWEKLSPMLRQMVRQQYRSSGLSSHGRNAPSAPSSEVCAFIRISDASSQVLSDHGCRDLAAVGDIHIASIPVDRLARLSLDPRVKRIEARPTGHLLLDSVSQTVNAAPVYQGLHLPQAFTGKGVVVGLMDIGFDLTHPTFRHQPPSSPLIPHSLNPGSLNPGPMNPRPINPRPMNPGSLNPRPMNPGPINPRPSLLPPSRIFRFWDMLSTDTVGSTFYVGRDYVTPADILSLGHSRDGLHQSHGTHTSGIAAGNGYDSPYRGLAPESDICLVANAVSDNAYLIDSTLLSRFTFATDALGFKYLFDSARELNQPCVVSFSEGSGQDFWGYDQLYYEMLDNLLGPGRIMVVAAGNQGHIKSWFSKPAGTEPQGMFVRYGGEAMMLTLKSAADFTLRLVSYPADAPADTLAVPLPLVADFVTTMAYTLSGLDSVYIEPYHNCYDSLETCYDVVLYAANSQVGTQVPLSLEVLNNQGEVTCWRVNGDWTTNPLNPQLAAGETTHNILSPASAPRVICVGATTHRDSIQNLDGQWKHYWLGEHGYRAPFSSVGPTMDGRVKPDVMAPGNNIISAYSSYYLENHPTAGDIKWDVAHFNFQGRTYAWNSNTGTSMACPVVAGVIALWLQAKPDLTPEEALAVISRTSRRPDPSLSYPNNEYGYGEIDAYRGLLDILGLDRVEGLSTTHTSATIRCVGDRLCVDLPSPQSVPLSLRVYSLDGRQVRHITIDAGQTSHQSFVGDWPAGIYAVQLDGPSAVRGSTLVRRQPR